MSSIVITHRYFWPSDISVYPVMIKDIAEWHARRGDKVAVVTTWYSAEQRDAQARWAKEESVTLLHTQLAVDRGKGVATRLLNTLRYTMFVMRSLRHLRRAGPIDGLSAVSYPPLLPSFLMARKYKGRRPRFLYYVQDIFHHRLSVQGGMAGALGKCVAYVDKRTTAYASSIVTLSEDMGRTLGHPHKTTVLQNFVPQNSGALKSARIKGKVSRPMLVYAGNVGKAQNLSHVMAAVKIANASAKFDVLILGDGGDLANIKAIVSREGLTNVKFKSSVPRAEAEEIIASCDAGIVASEPKLFESAFPSKTLTYFHCGIPVLMVADQGSTFYTTWRDAVVGVCGDSADPVLLAKAIESLVANVCSGLYDSDTISAYGQRIAGAETYFENYEKHLLPNWLGEGANNER
jgi:glycosyltransferase involved in cell wall biosynthesis